MPTESYKMTDSFELPGKFWLPGKPDAVAFGRIQCSLDKIALLLEGGFGEPPPSLQEALMGRFTIDEWPCILGQTSDGQLCSLYQVLVTGQNTNDRGIVSRKCHVHFLLIGQHAEDFQAIRVKRIAVKCSHLLSFAGMKSFDLVPNPQEAGNEALTVKYAPVKKQSFRIEREKTALVFRRNATWNWSKERLTFLAYESIDIIPDEAQALEWFLNRLAMVCNLLSLLIDEVVAPIEVRLSFSDDFDTWLLYQPIRAATGDEDRVAVMFNLDQVQDRLKAVLDKWYSAEATLREAIGLFLDARFARGLSLYTQFPMLAQSVEAFSRATAVGEYMTKEDYEPIRQALVKAIPTTVGEGHREALKKKIEYGYEFSLRKRIETMFSTLTAAASALVCKDVGVFTTMVVKTRNYLSHRTDELRESAVDGMDLYWTCEQLMILMRLLLLKHFGIEEDLIVERLQKGHRTSQVTANPKKSVTAKAPQPSSATPP
jgi:ApeA N-terminal domain 1